MANKLNGLGAFNIVKHLGRPEEAEIKDAHGRPSGLIVKRTEYAFYPPMGNVFIKMRQYDEHFLFKLPAHIFGPTWQCTCGSIAVATSDPVVCRGESDAIMVCYTFETLGHHANLTAKWE